MVLGTVGSAFVLTGITVLYALTGHLNMGLVAARLQALGPAGPAVMATGGDRTVAGLCLFGGLFHLFNHAAFKSLLFLSSGAFEQQVGTRGQKAMGGLVGLVRRMPVTAFCCRVGALSIAGVPPFNAHSHRLRSFLWTVEP